MALFSSLTPLKFMTQLHIIILLDEYFKMKLKNKDTYIK